MIDEDETWRIKWEEEKAESRALLQNYRAGDRIMLNDRAWTEMRRASKLMIGRRGGTVMSQRKNRDNSLNGYLKILWDGRKNADAWGTPARDVMPFDASKVVTKEQLHVRRPSAKERDWWMWA